MDLKQFHSLYNLNDSSISKIYTSGNDFIMEASFDFYQEFIANGCRSDFDYEKTYIFTFKNTAVNFTEKEKYFIEEVSLKGNELCIILKDQTIKIRCNEVLAEPK